MKTCRVCLHEKAPGEFYFDKRDGRHRKDCRACVIARSVKNKRRRRAVDGPDEVIAQQFIHAIWREEFSMGYA